LDAYAVNDLNINDYGRVITHRDGKRFIVKSDDLLTAFSFTGERRDSSEGKRQIESEVSISQGLLARETCQSKG